MDVLLICAALTVVDGDTLKCDGQNLRLIGTGTPHRSGFDAPETWKPDCEAERVLGNIATNRVRELIASGGFQVWHTGETDRFGRPLVRAKTKDGTTIGDILMGEGLAQAWPGGAGWC